MANYISPLASFTETQGYHNPGPYGGVDLAAPQGTPIRAIADGVVTRIGATGFGPFYIEIQHAGGVTSYYGHNSAANVFVGQHVTQGQVIGAVGSLGISTGPHVHFGIRANGQDVNPDAFLKGILISEGPGGVQNAVGNPLNIPGDILSALTGLVTGPIKDLLKTILGYLVNLLEVVGGFILIAFGAVMLFESTETGQQITRKAIEVGALVAK